MVCFAGLNDFEAEILVILCCLKNDYKGLSSRNMALAGHTIAILYLLSMSLDDILAVQA